MSVKKKPTRKLARPTTIERPARQSIWLREEEPRERQHRKFKPPREDLDEEEDPLDDDLEELDEDDFGQPTRMSGDEARRLLKFLSQQ